MSPMTDKEDLLKTLHRIGFSEKEAAVYLTLLELNEALPSTISRIANVKRSTAYLILEQLQKKGLATSIKKSGHLYFQACKPDFLISAQRKKYEEIKQQLSSLEAVLPELKLLHKDFTVTPQMSVYKGKEGLIQIMEDTLTVKDKMLLCWSNIDITVYTILEEYYPMYIMKKVASKIHLKGVFNYDKGAVRFKKRGEDELREVYLIPKELYLIDNEINIYDDKVSIISHQDEVGVIIQNEHIAKTQKSIFNLAFEYAKILEKNLLTKEDHFYLQSKDKSDSLTERILALKKDQ